MGLCWHRELWGLLSLLWYPQDELVLPVMLLVSALVLLVGQSWGRGVPGQEGPSGAALQVRARRAQGCREDVGLQGGQQPLLGVVLEAEEEDERFPN